MCHYTHYAIMLRNQCTHIHAERKYVQQNKVKVGMHTRIVASRYRGACSVWGQEREIRHLWAQPYNPKKPSHFIRRQIKIIVFAEHWEYTYTCDDIEPVFLIRSKIIQIFSKRIIFLIIISLLTATLSISINRIKIKTRGDKKKVISLLYMNNYIIYVNRIKILTRRKIISLLSTTLSIKIE